ncbi:LCP family protein [Nocardioides sp. TRM66260-LWL]|uniref:LCP family protein n=1 Tax=Nocardioides sp. TRM66260-LWL TaxID=2874478 RepID=UPI001CC4EFD0|nr:LCP family protein [Nocardioides sp. TRM66260-LWL]MBZ5735120.1 LCP family protein [Nocardioides sp. TRM66260-LWL]
MSPSDAPSRRAPVRGKRRARRRRRHSVGLGVLVTLLALALVAGLGTAYVYRDLNANLTLVDIDQQIVGPRPTKAPATGPQEPLNILVMGSDTRDGVGNAVDKQVGGGQRSDTTILLHVSGDRKRAYGISIPRDSMVDRPACKSLAGQVVPPATYQMWNAAFGIGGPACTVAQFESLTGIRVDHFVVVDFRGFRGMVDAIGGVQVCIPQVIDDRRRGIYFDPGTQVLKGEQALDYVRERHAVGDGSDVGRMKRQQAFIASMVRSVVSAGTLARPDRLLGFLQAATKSLTLDRGLGDLLKIADLGSTVAGIGLGEVKFTTIPNTVDPQNPNHLVWTPAADGVWQRVKDDEPLTASATKDAISAADVPDGSSATKRAKRTTAQTQALKSAGLCT